MADMSASSLARKKMTNKKPRTSSCPNLSNRERMYLDTLPDSALNRTLIAFFLYHGANVLVTQNFGVRYGVANGTRGIIVGWQFPLNTTFNDFCYHGVSAPVECVYVHVTNVRLKKRAPNQPHKS